MDEQPTLLQIVTAASPGTTIDAFPVGKLLPALSGNP